MDVSLRVAEAAGAARNHPRFLEAVRAAIGGVIETYSYNGLLNRVLNDRGRAIGGMIALYLHFAPVPGGKQVAAGLTAGRFQALCAELKLCSPGRARALLALMRYAGYLAPAQAQDLRQRRLVPTERLIELHRERWAGNFKAMALVMPEDGRTTLDIQRRPEFTAAFVRHFGAVYLAGFRLLHHAPDLAHLTESNAGLLVITSLFLTATDGRPVAPEGTVVLVSISALSTQFGITRTHARGLLTNAAEAGLVRRTSGSETVIVLPRLVQAVGDFFAAIFALHAHCAKAASEEIGDDGSVPLTSQRRVSAL